MMSLKEYMQKESKEELYQFYLKINPKALDYEKVTRNDMYKNIISFYKEDPEIILHLCSMEEIQILRKLLEEKIKRQENGYIDYLLFQNLMSNYLVLIENNEYYIPEDLVNYVKMAMNLFDEKEYSKLDVVDSVVLGLARIYNVISLEEVISLLKEYAIYYDLATFWDIDEKYLCDLIILDGKMGLRYSSEKDNGDIENLYFEEVKLNLSIDTTLMLNMKERLEKFIYDNLEYDISFNNNDSKDIKI